MGERTYLVGQHESDVLANVKVRSGVTGGAGQQVGVVLEQWSKVRELGRVWD
jgi:hypothetical protein